MIMIKFNSKINFQIIRYELRLGHDIGERTAAANEHAKKINSLEYHLTRRPLRYQKVR